MKKIALILLLGTISTLGISCASNKISTGDSTLDKELVALQKEQNQYEKDTKKDMQSGIFRGVKYTIGDSYIAKFTVKNKEENFLFVKLNMEPIKGNDNPDYYDTYPDLTINSKGEKLRVSGAFNDLPNQTKLGIKITDNIRYYAYKLPSDYIGYDSLTMSIKQFSEGIELNSSKFPTKILSEEEMYNIFMKDVEEDINEQKKRKTNNADIEVINVDKGTEETTVTIRAKNVSNLPKETFGVGAVEFIKESRIEMIVKDNSKTKMLNPGEEIEVSFRIKKDEHTYKRLAFYYLDTNFIVDEV